MLLIEQTASVVNIRPRPNKAKKAPKYWCEWCGETVPARLKSARSCSDECAVLLIEDAMRRKVGANTLAVYRHRRDVLRSALGETTLVVSPRGARA